MTATPLTERALGPDLARGLMLLCIALANAHFFLDEPALVGGYPPEGALDRAVAWVLVTFVDTRAYPLFALLVGYGIAQVTRRHPRAPRHLLSRRALVLLALGWAHGLLLYDGDVLAIYGMLVAGGALVVFWRDRWLWLLAALFSLNLVLPVALGVSSDVAYSGGGPGSLGDRVFLQFAMTVLGPIAFATPFLVGLIAGRRRILERPLEHRRLLTVVACAGIALGVLGAQPFARTVVGTATDDAGAAFALHTATGLLAGVGYAAALALLAARVREGRVVRALAATGQRSLTAYLSQSVVWLVLFSPALLDLSARLSTATTALLAALAWLLTVAACVALDRAGRRGPFETLLRRLTYGRRAIA